MLLTATPPQAPANQNQPGAGHPQQPPGADDDLVDLADKDISTANLIIMQSSFECKLKLD